MKVKLLNSKEGETILLFSKLNTLEMQEVMAMAKTLCFKGYNYVRANLSSD